MYLTLQCNAWYFPDYGLLRMVAYSVKDCAEACGNYENRRMTGMPSCDGFSYSRNMANNCLIGEGNCMLFSLLGDGVKEENLEAQTGDSTIVGLR
jgi:hypothetical protein